METGGRAALHLFERFDPQSVQALLQDFRGEVAEDEAAGAGGAFALQYGAMLEERREFAGEFVQIIAEEIRAIFLGCGFKGLA